MADDLIAKLRATRDDYEESLVQDRFNLDAYTGGGGFAGNVRPADTGYFPWLRGSYRGAGTAGANWRGYSIPTESYLDPFHSESGDKFAGRVRIAHYPNYVRTVTDLKLSFLLRRPFGRTGDERWADWYKNTDGAGTTLDEIRPTIVQRAANVGWCPCLVNAPRAEAVERGGSMSRAQAELAGIRPRLIPLWPANLLDMQSGESGQLDWAKIRTDRIERKSSFDKPTTIETYTEWTRDTWQQWTITSREGEEPVVTEVSEGPTKHGWGRVPLAILRCSESPNDPVRGLPMHGDVAIEAKRLFNLISELDEHLRAQVFALLTVAANMEQGARDGSGRPAGGAAQPAGVQNAWKFHWQWPRPEYIAPPASVAATLEAKIAATITELYRLARIEFARGQATATSGIARAFEFAQTNRALADFAGYIARWEEDVLDLTGVILGIDEREREAANVTPPDSFDEFEDLAAAIADATAALGLGLGVTVETELKKRIVGVLLPNIDDETRDQIHEDLEDEAAAKLAAKAAALKLAQAQVAAAERPRFGQPRPGAPQDQPAGNPPPTDPAANGAKKPTEKP